MTKVAVRWKGKPEKHDYVAAAAYLSLTMDQSAAKAVAKKLKRAAMSQYPAKDLFRASRLVLLSGSNSHVRKDQQKIRAQERLSPLLLYRDERNGILIIADGYHRICAVYTFDEDAIIPCKIV
jgi:disulfide oxidoreductase YuzD